MRVVRGLRCSGAPNANVPLQPGRFADAVRSGCLPSIATADTDTATGGEIAMTTSREEIAKLCEQLTLESEAYHEAGRFHLEKLLDTVRDALLSQQRSLDRVAHLLRDPSYHVAYRTKFGDDAADDIYEKAVPLGVLRIALEAQPPLGDK